MAQQSPELIQNTICFYNTEQIVCNAIRLLVTLLLAKQRKVRLVNYEFDFLMFTPIRSFTLMFAHCFFIVSERFDRLCLK